MHLGENVFDFKCLTSWGLLGSTCSEVFPKGVLRESCWELKESVRNSRGPQTCPLLPTTSSCFYFRLPFKTIILETTFYSHSFNKVKKNLFFPSVREPFWFSKPHQKSLSDFPLRIFWQTQYKWMSPCYSLHLFIFAAVWHTWN